VAVGPVDDDVVVVALVEVDPLLVREGVEVEVVEGREVLCGPPIAGLVVGELAVAGGGAGREGREQEGGAEGEGPFG
jgi:hypothetical protein